MNILRKLASALFLSVSCTVAQSSAAADRYPAQITFRVLTDEGNPVPNVVVTTSTFLRWQPGEGFGRDIDEETKTRTDADGLATVSFTSERDDCNYGIYDAPGYYSTRNLVYRFKRVNEGRWEPWNPTVDVVCKPVLNPIPMYARIVGQVGYPLKIPALNQAFGFDLMAGDWVAPQGKGITADLIVTLKELLPTLKGDDAFEYALTIHFSNEGDGIQSALAPPFKGSELRLPRGAPDTGYQTELLKQVGRSKAGQPTHPANREDQNYFFRVRTKLDDNGNIESALYGKIMGNVRFGINRSIQFTYYLNPTPLDRNLEFDRRRNLFDHLSDLESVIEP